MKIEPRFTVSFPRPSNRDQSSFCNRLLVKRLRSVSSGWAESASPKISQLKSIIGTAKLVSAVHLIGHGEDGGGG